MLCRGKLKSIKIVLNFELLCKLQGLTNQKAFEKYLLRYFSEVYPVEFFVFFERLKLQDFFRISKKSKSKKIRQTMKNKKTVIKLNSKIKQRNWLRIKERKKKKSEYYLLKTKEVNAEDLQKIEKCREVKIFSKSRMKEFVSFITRVTQLEFDRIKSHKNTLKFLNYTLTIKTK